MSKIGIDVNSFVSTQGKWSPQDFLLPFGTDTQSNNLFNNFFSLEIGSLLHSNLTKRIDVHSGIVKIDFALFYFYLL